MYAVDDRDRVERLEGVPQSDAGAPLPQVVADEHHLWLSYVVSESDPGWDGACATMVSPSSSGLPLAVVRFRVVYAHYFGVPNDEAFAGHPLAARGLRPYGAYIIRGSSWLRRLEEMNRVHRQHDAARYAELNHYVFAFHDSTFECVAGSVHVEITRGSQDELLSQLRAIRAAAG